MDPHEEAASSQVPSRSADTVPRPGSGVLTALRTRMMSPVSPVTGAPDFEVIGETSPWQFQDLANSQVSYLVDTPLRRSLQLHDGRGIRTTVAAGGGLVYAVYDNATHIVCNPQQRVFHHIQAPPAPGPSHSIVAMVVDAALQRYRIVVTGCGYRPDPASHAEQIIDVNLYDSGVRGWRRLCSAPAVACVPLASVVLDGVLFAMFALPVGRPFELFSCDLDTGEWRLIDAPLPREPRQSVKTRPQVVAAAGRLFFVGYHAPLATEAVITVSIWQIAHQDELWTVTEVARLSRFLDGSNAPEYWTTIAPVLAVGCGDSIVVSSFVGRRWRWDAVQGTWRAMAPFSPVEPLAACHSFLVAPFDTQMRPMPAL